MKKVILTAVIASVIGVASGWTAFQVGKLRTREGFYEGQWAATGTYRPGQGARLYWKSDSHIDLGTILTGRRYQRELLIENRGHEVGSFWLAGDPPSSIQLDMAPQVVRNIGPRSTYPILLTCTPMELEETFRKIVILRTSQQDGQLTLTVTGQIQPGVMAKPYYVTVPTVAEGALRVAHTDVCAFQGESLENLEVIDKEGTLPEWLQIRVEPMAESELSALHAGATSGRRVYFQVSSSAPADGCRLSLFVDLKQADLVPLPIQVSIAPSL